jgi:hypothetical protein
MKILPGIQPNDFLLAYFISAAIVHTVAISSGEGADPLTKFEIRIAKEVLRTETNSKANKRSHFAGGVDWNY